MHSVDSPTRGANSSVFSWRDATVMVETSHALPLVDLTFAFRGGALLDPPDATGLTRMLAATMRRGTRSLSGAQFEDRLATLGAKLSLTVGRMSTRVHLTVLSRNLEKAIALVATMLCEPKLSADETARAVRRARDELRSLHEDDQGLAERWLRQRVFGKHPYASPLTGTDAGLRAVRATRLKAHHAVVFSREAMVLGVSGPVSASDVVRLLDEHLSALPSVKGRPRRIAEPTMKAGRRAVLIDKKGRAQTQIGIATLAVSLRDERYFPFVVADTAFGGIFSGRLVREIREKRGLSYSVASVLSSGLEREMWSMWAHPAADRFHECASLMLTLAEENVLKGPTPQAVAHAKRFLVGSRCLDEDTVAKRIDLGVGAAVGGLDERFVDGYRQAVANVKAKEARSVFGETLDLSRVALVAVGDASALAKQVERLPGFRELEIIPHDAVL